MKDELARWVRGLGARTIEVPQVVEEAPLRASQARRQKTRLTAEDLPPEAIRLEINGRPFYVVLRDEKVYMSYLTSSGTTCVKGVKPRGARQAALELARLIQLGGCAMLERNVALACNWPNVIAPPLTLVALRKAASRLRDASATKGNRMPSQGSYDSDGFARTEITMAMLPGDAVEVSAAGRIFYVLLEQNMVFMRVESWNASTAYLREITDSARKKQLAAIAQEKALMGGRIRPFRAFG